MKNYYLLPLLFVCACASKQVTTSAEINEDQTRKVLQHHWEAFQANDLEGTMADYTEQSILVTPDKTYKGLTEIRANFVSAFGAFPKASSSLKLTKSIVNQDIGYIIWEATTPSFNLTFGTDTFIIQNGKIVRQTYAGVVSAK
jgi:hypothetical protein